MKVNYITKADMPKRKYTKWVALLVEFTRSDAEVMEIDPETLTDGQLFAAANNIRRSVKSMGLPVSVHKYGPRIYLEKMI